MKVTLLAPKSREAFLSDRYAIQPEETCLVYAEELVKLLLHEEQQERRILQLTKKVDLLQSLLDAKNSDQPPLIKLYA